MQTVTVTTQRIIEQIKGLPPESLDDLATYVDFLRFRSQSLNAKSTAPDKLRVVNLRGVLRGFDFSPEFVAEARREMWQSTEVEASEP